MRSGKLRYPAELLREVKTTTGTGAEELEYLSILHTRVGITTVNAREFIEGGAETMETTLKVVMRKPHDKRVLMGDLIRADKKQFKIMGVLEFDNGRSLQLMCKELI